MRRPERAALMRVSSATVVRRAMHHAAIAVMAGGYVVGGLSMGLGHQAGIGGTGLVTAADSASLTRSVRPAHPHGGQHRPLAGFDTCTAPSIRAMRAWRAKFSAAGIYIGGEDMARGYGNLSVAWVRTVQAMGWSLLPLYVGPQAPCDSYPRRIRPKQAAPEGRTAADEAIADAHLLGIVKGSPVYYDMEAYDRARPHCVVAVLTFLDAWTRRLDAKGYVSGVYSSADSAIVDLASARKVNGHRLAKPQCIWIGLWDHRENLSGSPYLNRSAWPLADRSKQFSGPHRLKVGGITLTIDSDLVDGPVVRNGHRTRRR